MILPSLPKLRRLAGSRFGRQPAPLVLADTDVADLRRALRGPRELIVDLADIRGAFLTRFGAAGDGPFQRASAAYLEGRRKEDIRRILAAHYAAFRPKNLAEALFGASAPDLHPLDVLSPFDRFLPWLPTIRKISGHSGGGNQSFGPVTAEKLALETDRLTAVTDSLLRLGYRPENFADGPMRGYVLVCDGRFRFLLTEGMHRAAALSALGAGPVSVGLDRRRPALVDAAEADDWPHVRSGFCSGALALRMVRRHFD